MLTDGFEGVRTLQADTTTEVQQESSNDDDVSLDCGIVRLRRDQ